MVETYRPTSLSEAVEIRAREGAIPFAGGTDLMVKYPYESGVVPDFGAAILFMDKVEEIRCVEREGDTLRIGGAATLNQVLYHNDTPEILGKAVRSIAAPALRNAGTVAGNLCNASPAGDSILALYTLDARIELSGENGQRILSVEDFIKGPGQTVLHKDELVSQILVPVREPDLSLFRKVGTRKANALTKVSLAARADFEKGVGLNAASGAMDNSAGKTNRSDDAVVESIAISVGAVAPTVVRNRDIEEKIVGMTIKKIAEKKEELVEEYGRFVRPIDDQRSTAVYRKKVALNMLRSFFDTNLSGKE